MTSFSDLENRLVQLLGWYDDYVRSLSPFLLPRLSSLLAWLTLSSHPDLFSFPQISTISATFIELNALVTSAEDQVSRLEKQKLAQEVGGEY